MNKKISFLAFSGVLVIGAVIVSGCLFDYGYTEKSYTTGLPCMCSGSYSNEDNCFQWQSRNCCSNACTSDYSDANSPCHMEWLRCLQAIRCPPVSTKKALNGLEAADQCGPPPPTIAFKNTFTVWTPVSSASSFLGTPSRVTTTFSTMYPKYSPTIQPSYTRTMTFGTFKTQSTPLTGGWITQTSSWGGGSTPTSSWGTSNGGWGSSSTGWGTSSGGKGWI